VETFWPFSHAKFGHICICSEYGGNTCWLLSWKFLMALTMMISLFCCMHSPHCLFFKVVDVLCLEWYHHERCWGNVLNRQIEYMVHIREGDGQQCSCYEGLFPGRDVQCHGVACFFALFDETGKALHGFDKIIV